MEQNSGVPNHEIDIDGFYSRRKILGSVECNASTGQPLPSPPSRPFKEFLLTLISFFPRSFLFSFSSRLEGEKLRVVTSIQRGITHAFPFRIREYARAE